MFRVIVILSVVLIVACSVQDVPIVTSQLVVPSSTPIPAATATPEPASDLFRCITALAFTASLHEHVLAGSFESDIRGPILRNNWLLVAPLGLDEGTAQQAVTVTCASFMDPGTWDQLEVQFRARD